MEGDAASSRSVSSDFVEDAPPLYSTSVAVVP